MSHLTQAERYHIAALLQAGLIQAQVTAKFHRSPFTISWELRRNSPPDGYDPEQAME